MKKKNLNIYKKKILNEVSKISKFAVVKSHMVIKRALGDKVVA